MSSGAPQCEDILRPSHVRISFGAPYVRISSLWGYLHNGLLEGALEEALVRAPCRWELRLYRNLFIGTIVLRKWFCCCGPQFLYQKLMFNIKKVILLLWASVFFFFLFHVRFFSETTWWICLKFLGGLGVVATTQWQFLFWYDVT